MPASGLCIRPVTGIPEILPGDDLCGRICERIPPVQPGSILVVAQKVVSKAERQIVRLEDVEPSAQALAWGNSFSRDPRVLEVVLRQSRRIVRMERGILITETRHGFVCANAGVDSSNAPPGCVVLLPEDPDASAERIRSRFESLLGLNLGVIISDTFGRPWRLGLTNVAIGIAGLSPFLDYRGQVDASGRPLQTTVLAVADELAGAAELVMGKNLGIPAALIEGYDYHPAEGWGRTLIRPCSEDLFR